MKWLISILILCSVHLGFSQVFNDVALTQGITNIQSTPNHLANGMTFYDFDEDGWDDLTFPIQNDSLVFYKNVNGNFQQIGSMLYANGNPREILWVDYDDDGDLDLCLTYAALGMRLYQNDGNFAFTDVTAAVGIQLDVTDAYGVSFADADADGDLDIYLSNYTGNSSLPAIHHNQFYVNQGNGTFIEMGALSGNANASQPTFMGVWYDFDEDDDIDLHVINDREQSADALYRNNSNGTYTDVAASYGVLNDGHYPMGLSISDYNNDGYQDVFLSDIANGTIVNGLTIDYKLYTNLLGNDFIDVAQTMSLDTNIVGWGSVWIDYDNDGFEDLYVATAQTGFSITTEQTSLFYHNEQGNDFTLINDSINGDILSSAYTAVKGDINNDGFYDIVVLNDGAIPNVFKNSGNGNNYIKITPVGTVSNQKAIGAKVRVYAGGTNQYQTVTCGSGLCSQNSQHMIFGVNDNTIVDSVVITFPSGIIVRKFNLAVGNDYTIVEHAEVVVELIPGTTEITLCSGDSIVIGSTEYDSIQWNIGSTDSLITVSMNGTYWFVAQNSAGDTLFHSTELIVTIEQAPVYQTVSINPECGIGNFGSSTLLFIAPPASNFTINWSNGDTGVTMDSAGSGVYTYLIESIHNCIYSGSVVLTETPVFNVQFITTPVTDNSLGTVEFFIFGGVPPFEYELNSQFMEPLITGLNSGNYSVIITDSNGCEVLVPFSIIDESTSGLNDETLGDFTVYTTEGAVWVTYSEIEQLESLTIRSITGEIVATKKDGKIDSADQWKSNLQLAKGIYLIVIESKGKVLVKRTFVY